jgi:hypothetical protein
LASGMPPEFKKTAAPHLEFGKLLSARKLSIELPAGVQSSLHRGGDTDAFFVVFPSAADATTFMKAKSRCLQERGSACYDISVNWARHQEGRTSSGDHRMWKQVRESTTLSGRQESGAGHRSQRKESRELSHSVIQQSGAVHSSRERSRRERKDEDTVSRHGGSRSSGRQESGAGHTTEEPSRRAEGIASRPGGVSSSRGRLRSSDPSQGHRSRQARDGQSERNGRERRHEGCEQTASARV